MGYVSSSYLDPTKSWQNVETLANLQHYHKRAILESSAKLQGKIYDNSAVADVHSVGGGLGVGLGTFWAHKVMAGFPKAIEILGSYVPSIDPWTTSLADYTFCDNTLGHVINNATRMAELQNIYNQTFGAGMAESVGNIMTTCLELPFMNRFTAAMDSVLSASISPAVYLGSLALGGAVAWKLYKSYGNVTKQAEKALFQELLQSYTKTSNEFLHHFVEAKGNESEIKRCKTLAKNILNNSSLISNDLHSLSLTYKQKNEILTPLTKACEAIIQS